MRDKDQVACLVCCLVLSLPLRAQQAHAPAAPVPRAEPLTDIGQLGPGPVGSIDLSGEASIDWSDLSEKSKAPAGPRAARFTLGHEASVRAAGERDIISNRSSLRLEYSRFFLDSFFVQFDSKLNGFWNNDHRARAHDRRAEVHTQEAFLQYGASGGATSLKAGVQRLIWGESEGGAITDVVSPRNFREAFVIPLEEARVGQFMLNVDHFSTLGDWSFFYIPRPKFNKYPAKGTAYFIEPFDSNAEIRDEPPGKRHEYGMRWKKTFGKSDISFMAASLLDNDYVYRADGIAGMDGMVISRTAQRFTMAGMTFNYAAGQFLVKGEVALKSPKAFNDARFQLVENDMVDSSLGVTYSMGQSNTVGVELVNSHVRNWSEQIVGPRRNTSSVVLNTNLFFLSETLSVNWLLIYNRPFTSYQSSIRTSYKWTDNLTFGVDIHAIDAPDRNSPLRPYRDMDQVAFKLHYAF